MQLFLLSPEGRIACLRTARQAGTDDATGELSTYHFNKEVIAHHFCASCGIAPFSEAVLPNGTEMAAINLRCVPEIDLAALTVTQYDGASR